MKGSKGGDVMEAQFDEYESLLETLDILEQEPDVLKKLEKAQKDIRAGKYVTWENVAKKKKNDKAA